MNDGTALVLYRFAVAAAVTGAFSPVFAAGTFVFVVAGGIAVGLGLAWAIEWTLRALKKLELTDSTIVNLAVLIAPYVVYLAAEAIHVSGVLATVAAGISLGRRNGRFFDPQARLVAYSVWELFIYLLNALVFLLIGLEVRSIVEGGARIEHWIMVALAISAIVIVVRIVWVFPSIYIPRWLSKRIVRNEPPVSWRNVAVVAWTGLRGIVSLAAALALPLRDAAGRPFPQRDPIVLITFCVILVTLVGQGLSLIPILRWLKLENRDTHVHEVKVRVAALQAGMDRLHELESDARLPEQWETLGHAQAEYRNRIEHLQKHGLGEGGEESEAGKFDHDVQEAALAAERREIARLRNEGEIPDDIFRVIEHDLDLAATRLS